MCTYCPARSGWSYITPLSITATTTSSEPLPCSQSSGARIAAGPHCCAHSRVVRRHGLSMHYVVRHRADDIRLGAQLFYKFLGRHAVGARRCATVRVPLCAGTRASRRSSPRLGIRFSFRLFYWIEVLYDGSACERRAGEAAFFATPRRERKSRRALRRWPRLPRSAEFLPRSQEV